MPEMGLSGSEGGGAQALPTPMCACKGANIAGWKSLSGQVNQPVTEGNCGAVMHSWRATRGEQPGRNAARPLRPRTVNSIRPGMMDEPATERRNLERKSNSETGAVAEKNTGTSATGKG